MLDNDRNDSLQQKVVIVMGPSGAGRSTAISALEDTGYEVIDNMPLRLILRLLSGEPIKRPIALGIDTRNRDFSPDAVLNLIQQLSNLERLNVETLYLDCQPDVLLHRFSETRRRHPLTPTGSPEQGIAEERALLKPLRAQADILLDTSLLSPHDLRRELGERLHPKTGGELAVTVQSFSYKRGMPRGLDLAFDVRFLRNPYWDKNLRELNGMDAPVSDYISSDPQFAPFMEKLADMLTFLLPGYKKEGKAHLLIGIGCTGGQHRSVFIAENLTKLLAGAGWQVSTRHRELLRRGHNNVPQ